MRVLAVMLLLALAGCASQPAEAPRVPVSGTVKHKGQPLSGATVNFFPLNDTFGFPGTGRTNAEGKYTVTDFRGKKGLVEGNYKVHISRRLLNGQEVPEDDKTPPIESPASESLPPQYSMPERSKLTAKVAKDGASIDFDLK